MRRDEPIGLRALPRWIRNAALGASALLLSIAGFVQTIPETPFYGEYDTRGQLMVRGWCGDGEIARPPPAAACVHGDGSVSFQSDWEGFAEEVHRSGQATIGVLPVRHAVSLGLTLIVAFVLPFFLVLSRERRFRFEDDLVIVDGQPVWNADVHHARVRGLLARYLEIQTEDFEVRIGPLIGTAWEAEAIAQRMNEAAPPERRLPW